MVLQLADDDIVALSDELVAPGIGHGIDRCRSTGREDDFLFLGSTDPRSDARAGRLVTFGHLLRKEMHAPMDVGIQLAVQPVDGLDHLQRFLGRSSAVEIDQRSAVDLASENRELPTYFVDVEHGYMRSILRATASTSASPKSSSPQRRTTSPANPSICNRRACARLSPRCRM